MTYFNRGIPGLIMSHFVNPGSLFKTRCMTCGHEAANYKSPICAALEGKG